MYMHITLHTRKITSHSSKKSRTLWLEMMDDSASTHKRRKLVKTYKNVLKMCSLENGLWLLKYAERSTPKNVIKWSRKTATYVINLAN